MSTQKRVISLLLCILFLCSLLSSCNNDDHKASTEQSQGATSDHVHDDLEVEPHTHTNATAVIENLIDATCIKKGSYDEVVYCSVCNEEISRTQKTINIKPHKYIEKVTTTPYLEREANCEEKAIYYFSCSCGAKGTTTFTYGEPNGHNYNQKVTTSTYLKDEATCEGQAVYYYSCSCGDKGTATFTYGEPNGHNYNQKVTTSTYLKDEATCEEQAVYYYSCSCGAKGTTTFTYGEPNGHNYNQKVTTSTYLKDGATCEEQAVYYYSCSCGAKGTTTFTYGVPAGHNYNQKVTTSTYLKDEATCEKQAVYYYSCSCGDKGTATFTSGELANHIPDTPKQENRVEATCSKEGSYDEVVYCSVCGYEISREVKAIEMTEHTVVVDPYVFSSCTTTGLTEGSHCSVCGTVLIKQEIIPIAHKYTVSAYYSKNCLSEAKAEYTCSVCGDSYTAFVEPITATIQKTNSEKTDGHYTSVQYTVTASGGLGELEYRHILWDSWTNQTQVYNSGFRKDYDICEIYSTNKTSMDDIVWIVTIKDQYGYAVHYYISVIDDTVLKTAYAYETHDYEDHCCRFCGKDQPYTQMYDISSAQDKSLTAKLYLLNDGTYELYISGSGEMTYSSVPWSSYKDSITKVTILDGATSIGDNAFYEFTKLQNIELPQSISRIGQKAFYNCTNLEQLTIEKNVISIGERAFDGCKGIKQAYVNATIIGEYAFSNCTGLTTLTIGENVKSIYYGAFSGCSYLKEIRYNAVSLDDTQSSYIFSNCGTYDIGITLYIGAKVQKIPAGLFNSSIKLLTVSFEENSVCESIGSSAFSGITNLVEVQLPNSITTIGQSAFSGCTGLPELIVNAPNIGDSAFSGCTGLTTLTIGEAVESIGNSAFRNCTALENIYFNAINMKDIASSDTPFQYAGQSKDGITMFVGNQVTRIPAYLFDTETSAAPNLISVEIAENSVLETIGNYAFNYCENLTRINLPESLSSIGYYAFYNCISLTEITIPSKLVLIDDHAFSFCDGLKAIYFKAMALNDVYNWDNVFAYSGDPTGLKLVIGANVTRIPECIFYYCDITMVVFEEGSIFEEIDNSFDACYDLIEITIPNSVKVINSYAFENCDNITTVYYGGTENEWKELDLLATTNGSIFYATIYYYSELAPTEVGNYWHYDENGTPTVWEVSAS